MRPTSDVDGSCPRSRQAARAIRSGLGHYRAVRGIACLAVVAAVLAATTPAQTPAQPPQKPVLTERFEASPDFSVAYPAGWTIRQVGNLQQMFAAPAEALDRGEVVLEDIATVVIHTEQRTDQAEALLRLKQIEAESEVPSRFLEIGGWPALHRQQTIEKPYSGRKGDPRPERRQQIVVTTAIAADDLLIRFEAVLPSNATPAAILEVVAVGEGVTTRALGDPVTTRQEIERLSREPVLRSQGAGAPAVEGSVSLDSPPPAAEFVQVAASPLRVTNQAGIDAELEISVSTNGRNIVIGSNGNYFFSTDGGQTFATSGGINGNDPSLGFGASGAFYAANIGNVCNTAILRSTNNGQTFTATTSAYTCPNAVPMPGMGGCVQDMQCGAGFPDQEHIAVDRFNPAPGGDQVYSTWRSLWSNVGIGIVCSQNNGANWTNAIFTLGDFPRIAVGQDGRVYVVYREQNNIQLWRLSSCATGLVPQAPVVVATGNPQVPCPVPGLNRCNDGNNLSSPTVAVDDTNANHIFVSYAVNTAANNENVLVQDSVNGGANWGSCRSACGFPLPGDSLTACTPGGPACPVAGEVCCPNTVQVSSGELGRRFMPWVCSVGGRAYVGWYDRRNATPGDNSLTDYFSGSAERDGFALGAGDEIQYTPVSDSHCGPPSTNWAGTSPRSNQDSESCTQQPQFAGQCATGACRANCNAPMPGDSLNACNPGGPACPMGEQCCVTANNTRCDFSDCGTTACNMTAVGQAACQCPANQFCVCGGGNPPRHGDYNGNACMAGRLYSTWVSATSPPGMTPASTGIDIFFNSTIVCCVPEIQVPNDVAFGQVCLGDVPTRTLEVCNTGKEDLIVSNITSSNAAFIVEEPSPGYPVVISPDFCFPFQVFFVPAGFGLTNTQINVFSNDPVNPIQAVSAFATVGEPEVRVTGSGDFGDVCPDDQGEKTIDVCNVGVCNLSVVSASINCADFTIVNNPFPATVSPDFCMGLTVRFTPTSAGPKSCKLTITTNDPDNPMVMITLTANTPSAMIDVPPDLGFPPEVIQDVGACSTALPFPVSNTGTCPLTITNFEISTNPAEFSLSGLPSFPIILEPGHIAGEGDLQAVFAPEVLDRSRQGVVSVTYVSEPILGTMTTVERDLCGEGVRTGARVLVTQGGVPMPVVSRIALQRINANRNRNRLDSIDVARNLTLTAVVPPSPCAPFEYHREYGTVSNPIQLLPGSYQVTVQVRIDGKILSKVVGFDVTACDFNPTIMVDF